MDQANNQQRREPHKNSLAATSHLAGHLADSAPVRVRLASPPLCHHRGVWLLTLSPQELVLRSIIVYALFLAALRLSGKRELGQFTIFDLALVLLAANALQPAITGPDSSIPGALIIVVTLFVLNRLVAFGRSRSVVLRRILDYSPTTIAEDGSWVEAAINREGLDIDDLVAALHEHGLESVDQVRLAFLEHDGSVSVVPRAGSHVQLRARARRYRHKSPASQ
jgi:uncharacterized membrane protein YcaP (DUF421 family)